jgi:predicted HicB family RNase H-like nuclease
MKDTRLIALIEPSQMKALKAAAKRQNVSLAEVVRQAIAAHLETLKGKS